MKLLGQTAPAASVNEAQASTHPWTNPGWWGGMGDSVAGVAVGPDTALKISTAWACVGLLSETIAGLPLVIYQWLENEDGRERARNHPLYAILHDGPNNDQTAFEFVQMMQAHALLRGSGYALIKPGPRGFVDQLIPLHPDNVQKERLTNGLIRYTVTHANGNTKHYQADEIFEVGGLSLDGVKTLSVIGYARDSFGLTLAAERYGGRLFRNDSRPGGILRTDKKLTPEAAKRLKLGWNAAHTGEGQHGVAVLEEGLEWQQVGISPEEAQFLGTREFQAEDVCRWFRVPPHMVGLTSKATSWGSGIEEMSIGFITYTLRPWLTRWSQAVNRDLILANNRYFADFVIENLLRGDIAGRYSAYSVGRQWGWLSVNDIRRFENMNPIENGNAYLQPMNMTEAGAPPSTGSGTGAANDHYRLLAREAAGRLVRKERAAVGRIFEKGGEVETAVKAFYETHAELTAQTMQMSLTTAQMYCGERQAAALAAGGWTEGRDEELIDDLVGLALPAPVEVA